MSDVLLMGLDGLHWDILDRMEEYDAVPTIQTLRRRSPTGICKSTIPSLTCPALPTLYTGMNPGQFGVFDFVKPDGSIANLTDIDVPKLWDYTDDAGKQSLIAGMRTTHPAPNINGVFISGVLSPEDEPQYVTPENYRNEAERFNESYPHLKASLEDENRQEIANILKGYTEEQTDVFCNIFEKEEPDFGLLWLSTTDSAQHHLWGYDDHLADFFETVDASVNRIVSLADDAGFDVVFVSDHGFSSTAKYVFHANEWLYQQNHLSVNGGRLGKKFVNLSYQFAERYISDELKRRLVDYLRFVRSETEDQSETDWDDTSIVISQLDSLPGIDWNETTAHLSTRKGWGININKTVFDQNFDSVRAEIIDQLRTVETPEGRSLIQDAWPGEEIYSGRYAEQIPDIIVLFDHSVRARPSIIGRLFSPREGGKALGSHMTARKGILMATGPRIRDGPCEVETVDLYDIVPTLLHLQGIPVPKLLDGEVIEGIFAPDSDPATRNIQYQEFTGETETQSGKYGQGEHVRETLRDLGYL